MKIRINKIALSLFAMLMCASVALKAEVSREHRAIWVSPFLSNNWPTAALTTSNAETQKRVLRTSLNNFKSQGVNVLYYHVRANCDAMYESSYEPWSKNVSGTRGKAPVFDPFAYLVEQAHVYGIEVYAWVNPYRYHANVDGSYGTHELNYETSHPEWLINGKSSNRVLNPAIEAVKQRVVDVCKEIITKYDVDGLIFDDYFYPQGGMYENSSAPDYSHYLASGTSMSIADWRRANVNEMVSRVHKMVKETKPYVCFGISPAGRYDSPTVSSYGLPAAPQGDMNYAALYCDPLAWMDQGTVDFISPQIYWPSMFTSLLDWWKTAAYRFDRHIYFSTSFQNITEAETLIQQVLTNREYCQQDIAGIAFFEYNQFVNSTSYYNSTNQTYGAILKSAVFQTKALTPIRSWNNKKNPVMVANIKRTDNVLSWDAISGMRYTIYAVPENITDAEFSCQREYLVGVKYTNSCNIPSDKTSGYRYAVAVYDRYGNEYSPLFMGATQKTISAATLTAPINGAKTTAMFNFKWNGQGTKYLVEVAKDAAFSNMVGVFESTTNSLSSTVLPELTTGDTYYWRVVSIAPNALETTSASTSFIAGANLKISSPVNGAVDVSLTPNIVWEGAEADVNYLLEIATNKEFTPLSIVYKTATSSLSHQVPAATLSGYTVYYARVTATAGDATAVGEVCQFRTAEPSNVSAPVFVRPNANGVTLYSNQTLVFKPWSTGLSKVNIEVATSSSFPARSKITNSLTGYATETSELGSGTTGGWSKSLSNGTKYYVRARGEYITSSGTKYTDWSTVMDFVYSSEAGIDDVTTDKAEVFITREGVLSLSGNTSQVGIYSISGQLIVSETVTESTYDLSALANGAYIIVVSDGIEIKSIKYVK
ncbi:MAG: family 10 glycosylhydrolase [Muribaculaceae bacterium]|nr:family 10 glycosylhydrolase [Muribaculaceae bacterium]